MRARRAVPSRAVELIGSSKALKSYAQTLSRAAQKASISAMEPTVSRVTVGPMAEMEAFCAALDQVWA